MNGSLTLAHVKTVMHATTIQKAWHLCQTSWYLIRHMLQLLQCPSQQVWWDPA